MGFNAHSSSHPKGCVRALSAAYRKSLPVSAVSEHRSTKSVASVQLGAGRPSAFVLAAPEASLRSLLSGFNSRQRLVTRWLRVRGGPHKAVREGSIPSVATIEVWLNLVRAPRSGRGDCRFESGHLDHLSKTFSRGEPAGDGAWPTPRSRMGSIPWPRTIRSGCTRRPGGRTTRSGRSAASYKRLRRGPIPRWSTGNREVLRSNSAEEFRGRTVRFT